MSAPPRGRRTPLMANTPVDRGWRHHAACAGADTHLFFPDTHVALAATAHRYCCPCPVRDACKTEARRAGYTTGVWGGLALSGTVGRVEQRDLLADEDGMAS